MNGGDTKDERMIQQVPSVTEVSLSDSSGESSPRQNEPPASVVPTETDFDVLACRIIGPTSLVDLVSCPCCQQCYDDRTLNEPVSLSRLQAAQAARKHGSLFHCDDEDDEDDDIEDDGDILPGVLAAGVHYTPKRILVEGWLHKKGTGKDWMGSRSWKARWARLALARVDGYDIDVPLLMIYWFPSSMTPSTVIVLDSTVVLPVESEDKEKWNAFRFEVRHVAKSGNESDTLVTRTFTAPRKGRDAWVYVISQALLAYEKQRDKAKKLAAIQAVGSLRPQSPERSKSPVYDEVWTGDRFVKVEVRRPKSPPGTPCPPTSRPRTLLHPGSPQLPRPKRPTPLPIGRQPSGLIAQPSM